MTGRGLRPFAPLGVLITASTLVVAACGSSSHRAATTAPSGGQGVSAWHVAAKRTAPGLQVATIGGTYPSPAAIKVQVEAKPPVISQVDYSIDCEPSGTHPVTGIVPAQRTPLTASIPVSPRAPSCFVDVTVSKSGSTAMTLTLSVRPR